MLHRLAPQARAELGNIWNYIARESGNLAAGDGVIDAITERFYLLAEFPYMGRARGDLQSGLRSFPVGQYVIIYTIDAVTCRFCTYFMGAWTSRAGSVNEGSTAWVANWRSSARLPPAAHARQKFRGRIGISG
jgi:toxin ParE1/3/4